jgi:hypothetical protein
MQILRILADVRNKPEMFPEKDGRVIYSDFFNSKALSKEEILAWQNANDGGLEETRLTGEEFDAMIGLSGMVGTVSRFYEGTEQVKATYYCLPEIGKQQTRNPTEEVAETLPKKIPTDIQLCAYIIFVFHHFPDKAYLTTDEIYNQLSLFAEVDKKKLEKVLFEFAYNSAISHTSYQNAIVAPGKIENRWHWSITMANKNGEDPTHNGFQWNNSIESSQEQIDELGLLSYAMLFTSDWFTPSQLQKGKPQYTEEQILNYLNKAAGFGFFQMVNKAFEEGYPKFKKTVKFISAHE